MAGSRFAGGIEGQMRGMRTMFPDLHVTIEEVFAEDNNGSPCDNARNQHDTFL